MRELRRRPAERCGYGTRGSALALTQAGRLERAAQEHELIVVTTTSDRDRAALDKERWVRELDERLLQGDVNLAVHSAKDVPARLPTGSSSPPSRCAPRPTRSAERRRSMRLRPARAWEPPRCGARLASRAARGSRAGGAARQRRHSPEAPRRRRYERDRVALAVSSGLARAEAEATGILSELVPCAGQGALLLRRRARPTSRCCERPQR